MSEQSPQSVQTPPSAQMFQYIISLMTPQAIHLAAKLGIADVVAKAPSSVEELAAATESNAPSLSRLLKFLTSLGIFSEDASGKYHQTPLSDTLRADHPQSTRGLAVLWGSGLVWKSFGELATTIATGQPAFNHVFGTSFFEYLSAHPEDAAIFNHGMTSISSLELPLIIAAYD
ncbi:MAG TPA: methyltransferase dimerization domain-containing protein, partial [Candidatus Binataceae bacterium]